MELTSERLLLVPMERKYIEDIHLTFTSEIARYMVPKQAESRTETEEFVERNMEKNAQGTDMIFVATKKADGEFLGCIGIHSIKTQTPKVGLWIKKAAHGHGYGMEGMNALIRYAYEHLSFHHIVYDVDRNNLPSRRIAEKNGGIIRREYNKYGAAGNRLDLVEYWLYKNPAESAKRPPVLLFQGDSITDVGRDRNFLYDLGNGYPHKIQDRLPGCIVINKGISGHRTVELLQRWDADTIQIKPDFLSILIGINEVWHKYLHNHPMTLELFESTYRTLLTAVKTKLPETKILLIEPFVFPFGHYDPIWKPDVDAEKRIVRKLAVEFADYFLPMDDILHQKAETVPQNAILIDGVHPTDLGHDMIADSVMGVINTFLSTYTGLTKQRLRCIRKAEA